MVGPRTLTDLGEVPITQYEKERALKVMRNNKMLISLGIAGLTSLTRSSNTRKNSSTYEDFDPLYEPHHNEDNVHHVADKGPCRVYLSTVKEGTPTCVLVLEEQKDPRKC